MFENSEIALENLPAADDVQWQPLDRRFVRRQQVRGLMNAAVVAAGVLVLQFLRARIGWDVPVWLSWTILAAVAVNAVVWPMVSVPRKGYALRDKDLVYRDGVFWRSVTAVPFNRVQHVETASTPLDRRFGLASLQLYTAGSSGGDLAIHGLPADFAERMRVFVLRKAGDAVEHG
jgi:uncharacterized protein